MRQSDESNGSQIEGNRRALRDCVFASGSLQDHRDQTATQRIALVPSSSPTGYAIVTESSPNARHSCWRYQTSFERSYMNATFPGTLTIADPRTLCPCRQCQIELTPHIFEQLTLV